MKKINNKGFMIAELLIVTIAIMVIFTAIYSNFYPTMGEYEKRETYNNINALYSNFYVKTAFLKTLSTKSASTETTLLTNANKGYVVLVKNGKCQTNLNIISNCDSFVSNFGITDMILTSYNTGGTTGVKTKYNSGNLKKYIDYLPTYNVPSTDSNYNLYRLITKTNDGYATSTFYSKQCEPKLWSDWNFTSCTVSNTCETKKIWVKYEDWDTMICDTTNPLCETHTIYKEASSWSATACDTNSNNCEAADGYLTQICQNISKYGIDTCDITYSSTTINAIKNNVYTYSCAPTDGSTDSNAYATEELCQQSCTGSCTGEITNRTFSCPDGFSGGTSNEFHSCTMLDSRLVNCSESNCDNGNYTIDCDENEQVSTIDIGGSPNLYSTYNNIKCTPATIYRTTSPNWSTTMPSSDNYVEAAGYRMGTVCPDESKNCCNEGETCVQKDSYRTKSIDNTVDTSSPFVTKCN